MQYKIPPKVLEIKYSQSQIFSLHFSIIRNNFAIMMVKERFISVKSSEENSPLEGWRTKSDGVESFLIPITYRHYRDYP